MGEEKKEIKDLRKSLVSMETLATQAREKPCSSVYYPNLVKWTYVLKTYLPGGKTNLSNESETVPGMSKSSL